MNSMHLPSLHWTVFCTLFLAGCHTPPIVMPPNNEALYAALHPYYAELCAVSEINKKPGFGTEIHGGAGGHAVLYLNGVCRDKTAHYPAIKLCDQDIPAAEAGVGLSVNAHFKNANWTVTEGRDFFFRGALAPDDRLDYAAYQQTQAQAMQMGILDGIEFHAVVFDDKPPEMSPRDYMYDVSIGTDYAIAFARNRYCVRAPMDRAQMADIVEYLNGVNDPYRFGRREFKWSVLQNNCSHTFHNALSTADIWPEWQAEQFVLFAAFSFPVPKNEFVNLMRRMNDMPIADLPSLYADEQVRHDLMENGRLPTEPGTLAEAEAEISRNDIYEPSSRLIFYDEPLLGTYQKHFDEIFSEPRYFDVRENLEYFSKLYKKIKSERRPLEYYAAHGQDIADSSRWSFSEFYKRYYEYIDKKSTDTDAALDALNPGQPTAQPVK